MSRMLSSSIVNAQPVQEEAALPTSIPDDFAARFSCEVAAPKKLKEYEDFALKHKAVLLAESKQLSEKFSEDLQTAMSVEKTVVGKLLCWWIVALAMKLVIVYRNLIFMVLYDLGVFDMLNQFIGLLKDQEDVIVDVHESSKVATQHVKETDDQLLLTIERSKNYQRSTVMLVVIMAVFLLILDAITP